MFNKQMGEKNVLKMLKCIRCSSIKDLEPYKHKSGIQIGGPRAAKAGRISVTEHKVWTKKFPVCNSCMGKFKKRKITNGMGNIIFSISLCFLVYGGLMTYFTPSSFYLVIIGLVLLPISILVALPGWRLLPLAKHYMNVVYGLPSVKPENSTDWIPFSIWAKKVLRERILEGTLDPNSLN